MQTLDAQFRQVHDRILAAEKQFHRSPGSVQLLAVSKAQPAASIEHIFKLGQRDFGENYPQEALAKIRTLAKLPIRWHFIGQVQTNKTRDIAEYFDWVHSIDRYKIAQRLNDQRPANRNPLNVCLQIKLEDEVAKGGIGPDDALTLADRVAALPRLKLRGLMCIPIAHSEFEMQRRAFARLRLLQQTINRQGHALDTLSMGMSGDLEAAIAEGATWIRVGTAIFGPRP